MDCQAEENFKKWNKLKMLLEEGSISLNDLAAILPGILHVNNRRDLSFEYLSPKGCELIGYSNNQLKSWGPKVFKKHQSAFTREITHPKVLEELSNGSLEKNIVFYQDWKTNSKTPFFFLTSTRILNNDQLFSISLFPNHIKYLTPKVNRLFGINSISQKYFNGFNNLTRREKEILSLLGQDFTRTEIACQLYVSDATIKKHCENIYRKLGTHKRTELEKIAVAFITMEI